jgi:hypothetical protein
MFVCSSQSNINSHSHEEYINETPENREAIDLNKNEIIQENSSLRTNQPFLKETLNYTSGDDSKSGFFIQLTDREPAVIGLTTSKVERHSEYLVKLHEYSLDKTAGGPMQTLTLGKEEGVKNLKVEEIEDKTREEEKTLNTKNENMLAFSHPQNSLIEFTEKTANNIQRTVNEMQKVINDIPSNVINDIPSTVSEMQKVINEIRKKLNEISISNEKNMLATKCLQKDNLLIKQGILIIRDLFFDKIPPEEKKQAEEKLENFFGEVNRNLKNSKVHLNTKTEINNLINKIEKNKDNSEKLIEKSYEKMICADNTNNDTNNDSSRLSKITENNK